MFEQDYIMRLIKELVRTLLKLLFHIDTDSPTVELLKKAEQKAILNALLDMVEEGRIDEAENEIYEMTETLDKDSLEIAVLFYSYLNDKSDEFLEENHFSRDEVKQGLKDLISRYGLDGIAETFLQ